MKTSIIKTGLLIITSILLISSTSCNKDEDIIDNQQNNNNNTQNSTLTQEEKDGLLFMWEEEKLARDTYKYLDSIWGINQFANIKNSEQRHMESVEALLDKYGIPYTLLPEGEFSDRDIQALYDDFVVTGATSKVAALTIGATIEDLDIFDLKQMIQDYSQADINQVLEQLLCASGNHMQAFTKGLNNNGSSYTPQYISTAEYQEILDAPHGGCGN